MLSVLPLQLIPLRCFNSLQNPQCLCSYKSPGRLTGQLTITLIMLSNFLRAVFPCDFTFLHTSIHISLAVRERCLSTLQLAEYFLWHTWAYFEDELLSSHGLDLHAVGDVLAGQLALDEVVEDGLAGEVGDQEWVEAPVDGVKPLERFVHRQEQSVLLVCKKHTVSVTVCS